MTVLLAQQLADFNQAPSKSEIDCAIAQRHFDAKRYEMAMTVVNMVLNDDPDIARALMLVGLCALMMSTPGLGYALLTLAMQLSKKGDVRRNYASACIGVLRLDEAKRVLQELRRERPNDEKALALL